MARYWSDKDGNGQKLTDGRICLVIEPADPSLPTIRTYGKDEKEVLDKIANTAETAQAEIHRLRKAPPTPHTSAPAASPATGARVSADEQARATVDLNNPAKAPDAIKTLLRAGGVDVDQDQREREGRRISALAAEWERENPDFPFDPRNGRLLIDRAILKAGGYLKITKEHLSAAFQELQDSNMLFEPAPPQPGPSSTVQPRGTEDSRTVRTATTYRRNSLRSPEPIVSAPKPKYTPADIDKLTSKQLRDKIENEPGFREMYEKLLAKSA